MNLSDLYALALSVLGLWGIHALRKSVKKARGWSWRRRRIVFVDVLFVVSCLCCAAALWIDRFQAWMAASVGLSYLLMIPFPCYFEVVNRVRWLHATRNCLFGAVALFLFGIAAGIVPLSSMGLR